MGIPKRLTQEGIQEELQERLRAFIDPQLDTIGLGVSQINSQSLEKLHRSLERVNDAIRDPSAFSVLHLRVTADGVVLVSNADEAHFNLGALPILLQRKQLIIERIAELGGTQQIKTIRDLISQISDDVMRDELLSQIEDLEANSRKYEAQASEVQDQQARVEESIRLERAATMVRLEVFERRSKVLQSFLERESIASIVGAILLVALAVTLVTAMFNGTNPSEVVTNSFLIILGYFFGQTATRRSPTDA